MSKLILVFDEDPDLIECNECGDEIEIPIWSDDDPTLTPVCSSCREAQRTSYRLAKLMRSHEPEPESQWEACYAVEHEWRDCKGPLDCDGTCWRGEPPEQKQGSLF